MSVCRFCPILRASARLLEPALCSPMRMLLRHLHVLFQGLLSSFDIAFRQEHARNSVEPYVDRFKSWYLCRQVRNLRTFVERSTRSKLDTLCRHVPTLCRSTGRHARNRNFATRRSQFCSNFSVYIFIGFYSSAITRVQAILNHNPSIKSEQKTQQTTCCLAGCIPPQPNADFAEEYRTVYMATGFQVLH